MREIPVSTYLVRVKKCFPPLGQQHYRVQFKRRYWFGRWHYHVTEVGEGMPVFDIYMTVNYDLALFEAAMVHDALNVKDERRRYTYVG